MALSTASIGRIGHFARPAQTRAPRSLGPARAAAGHVVDFGRSAVEEETIESAWPPAWWTDGPAFARIMAQEECAEVVWDHLARRALEIAGFTGITTTTWVAGAGSTPAPVDRRKVIGGGAKRVVICIAGAPGSGKTTLAEQVVDRINRMGVHAQHLPMDGFHYYRNQLDTFPNPAEAHQRRGSHWTINAARFHSVVRGVRNGMVMRVPAFDDFMCDPVEGAISIDSNVDVVVCEGPYLLMQQGPWAEIAQMADETWFVDSDLNEAMNRVLNKRVDLGAGLEEAMRSIQMNDAHNALEVDATKQFADVIIPARPIIGKGYFEDRYPYIGPVHLE